MLEGKNVTYVGDMTIEGMGTIPCYELTEPNPEEVRRRAMITNRQTFEYQHGRPAVSDDEVLEWVFQMAYGDEAWPFLALHYQALGEKEKAERVCQRTTAKSITHL